MIDHATYVEYRKAYNAGARNNVHTGLMEQYEIVNYRPQSIFAYYHIMVLTNDIRVTTWTGEVMGSGRVINTWRSTMGDRRAAIRVTIGGVAYHGTAYLDAGDYCRLWRAA